MAITRIEGQDGNNLKVHPDGSIDANVQLDLGGLEVSVDTSNLKIKDSWEGDRTETKIFHSEMLGLCVVNDGEDDLIITVNGMDFKLKHREVFEEDSFEGFTTMKITATGPYRALVKG